jgi:hypothetical protein
VRLGGAGRRGSAEAGVLAVGAEIAGGTVGHQAAPAMDLIELSDFQGMQGFPAQLEILLGQFLHSVSFSGKHQHESLDWRAAA